MTQPTKEELEITREGLRNLRQRMARDPKLARAVIESLNEHPLAEQPPLTPLERSERLLKRKQG